jgi:hypothetical protein
VYLDDYKNSINLHLYIKEARTHRVKDFITYIQNAQDIDTIRKDREDKINEKVP